MPKHLVSEGRQWVREWPGWQQRFQLDIRDRETLQEETEANVLESLAQVLQSLSEDPPRLPQGLRMFHHRTWVHPHSSQDRPLLSPSSDWSLFLRKICEGSARAMEPPESLFCSQELEWGCHMFSPYPKRQMTKSPFCACFHLALTIATHVHTSNSTMPLCSTWLFTHKMLVPQPSLKNSPTRKSLVEHFLQVWAYTIFTYCYFSDLEEMQLRWSLRNCC